MKLDASRNHFFALFHSPPHSASLPALLVLPESLPHKCPAHKSLSQTLLPGNLDKDKHSNAAGDELFGLTSGKQVILPSIHWRQIRKASQGQKPLPC